MKSFLAIIAVTVLAFCGISSASAGTSLLPPSGYASNQMIFEDTFTSSTLNTAKWNPWLGDDNFGRWGDQGQLPSPYSGVNCNSTCSNAFQNMYYDPYPYGYGTNTTGNHLVGGNGKLALIATPSGKFSNLGFAWASSAVTTFGKVEIPTAGGYVQFHAKMPDSRSGAWASLWLMSSGGAEIDLQESGYVLGTTNPNNVLASNWHGGGSQAIQNTGMDLSAGYHTYGAEYRPGQWIKIYLDGNLMATYTQSIPTNASYELLIDLEIANSNTNGWHTIANPSINSGPFEFDIDDVQVYSLAIAPQNGDTTPPSVPVGLVASMDTPVEVDLAWNTSTDNVGVAGYKIVRNGVQIATSTTPSYVDVNVIPNTTYSYSISAYDAAGNVSGSSGLTLTTPTWGAGAAVTTSVSTNVMSRAGRGSVVCTQSAAGTILSGPQTVKGLVWWYVGFVSGCSGWVPQSGLVLN